MSAAPRVTVLMSAYNAAPYVAEAVDSVLGQTYGDFEFLIFEDASTDGTQEVLRSYGDTRIRLVENNENLGLTRNLVSGLAMARGAYIARMDADDVCVPHRLEAQVAYMNAHPQISVLGSAVTFFSDSGWEFVAHQPLEHEEIKCTLFYSFTMLHPSVMFRRTDLERCGLTYEPSFPHCQDHDLWVRAVRKVRFANLFEPLVRMREHEAKMGRSKRVAMQEQAERVRRRQFDELGLDATPEEFRLFCTHDGGAGEWGRDDCRLFERLLLRIFDQNRRCTVFHEPTLERMGAATFRGVCRQLLLNGNRAGRCYWRSRLARYDRASPRQLAGLALRSLLVRYP